MLRKLSLVAVAAASLGVAALAPTSASAWGGGWHGGWHHGWGWGPLGTPLAAGQPLLLTKTALARSPKAPGSAPFACGEHNVFMAFLPKGHATGH
jgi:hypothetical protein